MAKAQPSGRFCPIHPDTQLFLVCKRCQGKRGGRKLAKSRPRNYFSKLGKLGGRPRKSQPPKKKAAKKRARKLARKKQ